MWSDFFGGGCHTQPSDDMCCQARTVLSNKTLFASAFFFKSSSFHNIQGTMQHKKGCFKRVFRFFPLSFIVHICCALVRGRRKRMQSQGADKKRHLQVFSAASVTDRTAVIRAWAFPFITVITASLCKQAQEGSSFCSDVNWNNMHSTSQIVVCLKIIQSVWEKKKQTEIWIQETWCGVRETTFSKSPQLIVYILRNTVIEWESPQLETAQHS